MKRNKSKEKLVCLHFVPANPDLEITVRKMPQKKFSNIDFKEIQSWVGGHYGKVMIPFKGKITYMIVHEEGRVLNLPSNPRATAYWQARLHMEMSNLRIDQHPLRDQILATYQQQFDTPILGDVVIVEDLGLQPVSGS
ncbi:DUF3846 domain-containing protein [Skermanella mucosa]|uniref:DUF3846 domain-containing protein n=1 Tax=Skermanella mucosa TaxID=1789672 RepID=UPI00192CD63F